MAFMGAAFPTTCQAGSQPPNVLLIVADDLGYGELGAQGNSQIPTPHIDSIAQGGIRFTSGYVSGPYCSPTRAGLLTGRYQQRFGHELNPGPESTSVGRFGLPVEETTLAARLKQAGYATGMFGKWHLGYRPEFLPINRGFDEYFGFLGGAHSYLDASGDPHNPIVRDAKVVTDVDYTTTAFGREAAAFIERHKAEPWFVYLPFNAVHAPLQAPTEYLTRFAGIEDEKRRTYAAMTAALDDAVGVVLSKLKERQLEENTLIFFVSDNGGPTPQTTSSNKPLRGFKATTWEGGIRVPFFVQWKGRLPAGVVYAQPVIQLDILPTVLAAAAIEAQPDWKLDGVNLLPYLEGTLSSPPHEALFWRFGNQLAVRKGDWKLVKAPGAGAPFDEAAESATPEGAHLYNLAQDQGEQTNVAAQEPDKVKELTAEWAAWNAQLVPPAWHPIRRPAEQAAIDTLNKALSAPVTPPNNQ
jgi:arylsulfatase A-like enzyme